MGSSQKFRFASPLRREKSQSQPPIRRSDGKEHKAQHILGITETDLNTARNESISSSTTTRLPRLSLSDATTEFGSSTARLDKSEPSRDVRLKASSVLLHEEYHLKAEHPNSIRSSRLRASGSSSTLNSHYDAQRTPLSVSQQTSESSTRDFALRKGSPVVIQSTTPDQDSLRRLRLFRSSRNRDKLEKKKSINHGAHSPYSPTWTLFGNQRPSSPPEQGAPFTSAQPVPANHPQKRHKDVRFQPSSPERKIKSKQPLPSNGFAAIRPEASHVKVNIRRPKVGVKHWFDGLEGDSSADESIHEPQLQPSFVAGMEMAFEDGRIGPMPKVQDRTATFMSESSSQGGGYMVSKAWEPYSRRALPVAPTPPGVATLNAKSSKSTLRRGASNKSSLPSAKPKASSLASTDLHQTSVLDLSSSEDDETPPPVAEHSGNSLPRIRDSIAVESLIESEIEIGTAQAVDTKQTSSVQATPSLRRVYGTQTIRNTGPSKILHNNIIDPRSSYVSDQSFGPVPEENDLLTSFPPTPTDPPGSRRASLQSSCRSDNASIESRRLVSVTRQEESLLAAMRLRKLALNQSNSRLSGRGNQVVRGQDRRADPRHGHPISSLAGMEPSAISLGRKGGSAPSIASSNFDRVSCTTFRTGMSNEPSVRLSFASFKTDTSVDPDTDMCSSLGIASPMSIAQSRSLNRMSRATFFSTSTSESKDGSCSRRGSGCLSTLEKLQTVPKREEIPSQAFIDFPYHGWEAKTKLATAATATH